MIFKQNILPLYRLITKKKITKPSHIIWSIDFDLSKKVIIFSMIICKIYFNFIIFFLLDTFKHFFHNIHESIIF